jgi:vancomycin resistance protein YoaR
MVLGTALGTVLAFGSFLGIAAAREPKVTRIYDVAWPVRPETASAAQPAVPSGVHYETMAGDYSTRFAEDRNRAHNVRLAASAIDGIVIAPGATFSFNDTTGPRTLRRGYRKAPVVIRGELEDGIGGGVCQVASTLHAAAREAQLEIVERKAHSRPSHYIRRRLEAAVAFPELDLKIRNPNAYPVTISAAAHEGRLEVSILTPPAF